MTCVSAKCVASVEIEIGDDQRQICVINEVIKELIKEPLCLTSIICLIILLLFFRHRGTVPLRPRYLRVGIASGPLCAGVVDGRSFRATWCGWYGLLM